MWLFLFTSHSSSSSSSSPLALDEAGKMNNSLDEEEPDKHDDAEEWNEEYEEEDEENNHPIEEVRLTVPATDDPTLPAFTFRTLVLGLTSCCLLAFVNQFFGYRQNQIYVGSIPIQIVALPLGKLMAATLPTKHIKIPLIGWSFTLNPGPFNLKEHVLITIFANSGASSVYALHIVTSVKAFYKREIHLAAAFLLSQTTQMLGYGWAGLFRRYLVDSPYMWWPANLVQVSLFRALHDQEKRKKGGVTKLQFFIIVFVSSFAYYIIPGYFFPSISAISIACYVWKDSILIQQLGSGLSGLGIGSFGLDWSTAAGFLGSPLATPAFAIVNILAGFFLIVYVAHPLLYYNNVYEARRFPFISSSTFDYTGNRYDIDRVLDKKTFTLDIAAYDNYSRLYVSTFFAFTYGLSFASLTATVSHVALFTGKLIWQRSRETKEAAKKKYMDVHTRLMKQNYAEVPQWWFYIILVTMMILAIFTCEGFNGQLQLPWWGVVLACAMALVFTLPIGIIVATTNMGPGLNVITELVIGYLIPGKPLANVAFKTYGYISMSQGLTFLSDFKLGHYMKIPPKSMFFAQLMSSMIASSVYFGTAWWLLTTVENICDVSKLPMGSPWTCPADDVFYSASIIWGVVGPTRMFSMNGLYRELNWFFLFGLVAPVPIWALIKMYPEKQWLYYINMPIIIGASQGMPPARSVNYITWGTVGLFFNLYIYKRFKGWWARHNYILSAGLDAGVAFMGILLFLALQSYNIVGPDWWGLMTDKCELASCPTAPGVKVMGCPVL